VGYKGTCFHQIFRDLAACGGDVLAARSKVTNRDVCEAGCGQPISMLGQLRCIPDKIKVAGLSHNRHGIVSMLTRGPDTNGCQFLITLNADLAELDDFHSIVGCVLDPTSLAIVTGLREVQIERTSGKPLREEIVIMDCGEY